MADSPGSVVVFGGRSEIGVAVAERLAAGRTVVLAARRPTTWPTSAHDWKPPAPRRW